MDQVKEIIYGVLTENSALCMDNDYERELAAELCEQALTKAVVAQVAALLGASMEVDNDGQGVIYTGVNFNETGKRDISKPLHDFLG
tara:strand:- start:211 stop:471 length:261 start_codon:yes stop_codon:yes gene_type:complete